MLGWMRQDVRYAVRTIRHHPGFFVIAATSLALGLGANTAVFSVFQAVVLSPRTYEEPEEQIQVWET